MPKRIIVQRQICWVDLSAMLLSCHAVCVAGPDWPESDVLRRFSGYMAVNAAQIRTKGFGHS